MAKIAIYCRVSTQMQNTDRQREELLSLAQSKSIQIPEKHIYVDVISGFSKTEIRPKFTELMKAVDNKEIDEIWFSELTRLGRSSVELLSEIENFQRKGIKLFFQKQNLTVETNKKDLGTQVLLSVLAVCSSYEIELFAERSLSGKINKVKNGGGIGGDNNAFGYMNDSNKKMVIREEEAKVIQYIYNEYANGKSTIEIADNLNANNIPTPLTTRAKESAERRKNKGLEPKENPHYTKSTKKWKPNMVSKILSNNLYTGHRHIIFHKPNLDKDIKKEPEIIYEYDEQVEELRIISDELFERVKQRLLQGHYNKNNAIKHENLLKHKMKCGECSSNFSVGKSTENATGYLTGGRSYKCYGKINRHDKASICTEGAEVKQWRLDGLVLTLSLQMFARTDIKTKTEQQINDLNNRNQTLTKLINDTSNTLSDETDTYKKQLLRLSILDDDTTAQELIKELQTEFTTKKQTLETEINQYRKEQTANSITIKNLQHITTQANLYQRMDEIWRNKNLVQTMTNEMIDTITLYRPHPHWILVITKYRNNMEMWGTLKTCKYRNDEMFFDEMVCTHGIEFHSWVINNSEQCFNYDKDTKLFHYNGCSTIYTEIPQGTYTFEQLNKILYDTQWIGSYPFYCYENNEYNINPPKIKGTKELQQHLTATNIITDKTPEWKKNFLEKRQKK